MLPKGTSGLRWKPLNEKCVLNKNNGIEEVEKLERLEIHMYNEIYLVYFISETIFEDGKPRFMFDYYLRDFRAFLSANLFDRMHKRGNFVKKKIQFF